MSAWEQKLENQKQLMLASQAKRIATDIEAKQMAAPDMIGKIKKLIQFEVEKNNDKLLTEIKEMIKDMVKTQVDAYCNNAFKIDEDYIPISAQEEDEEHVPDILSPPRLARQ